MSLQYLRTISLVIGDDQGKTFDLSNLHVRFLVEGASYSTLKHCEVRIWNLANDTAQLVAKEFKTITLKAGYGGNNQLIFQGQIGQVAIGREDSVDSFCDLFCQDGDQAANWGVSNLLLPVGYTDTDTFNALMQVFNAHGVTVGYVPELRPNKWNGSNTLVGMAFDLMTQLAENNGCDWFIDNSRLSLVKRKGFVPTATTPVLSSATGLIGTATQRLEGIDLKCLLNPALQIGGAFQLDNNSINTLTKRPGIQNLNEPLQIVPDINNDGLYKAYCVQHVGDTRETDWYTSLIAIAIDGTVPAIGPTTTSVPSGG